MVHCIALVGPTASGKTSAAALLAKHLAPSVTISSSLIITEELIAKAIPVTATNLRLYAQETMRQMGPTHFSRKIYERVAHLDNLTVIVDGVRNLGGIDGLKGPDSIVTVIGFTASEAVRIKRIKQRGRLLDAVDEATLLSLLQQEMQAGHEWECQIEACIARSDYHIDGNQSLKHVNCQTLQILPRLVSRHQVSSR